MPFMRESLRRDGDFLKTLLDTVKYVREQNPRGNTTDWNTVKSIMDGLFPIRKISKEALRNRYRRLTDIRVNQITKRKDDRVMGRNTLEKRVLAEIKRKRPLTYLTDKLGVTEEEILTSVARLQMNGYRGVAIFDEDGTVFVHNRVVVTQRVPGLAGNPEGLNIRTIGTESVTFAVVGDTHFGNLCADKKSLNKFYDEVHKRGIDTVLHTGDVTDGYYNNRPTSILEQDAVGFTNQLRMVKNDYPKRDGVTTYFITGNHDHTHLRNGFADIGEAIHDIRDDMFYLGHNFGRVHLAPKLSVSLIHPTDGVSQNYNKKVRDIIERSPERRSDLMFIGHYHKIAMVKHMGVWGFLTPSFEKRTAFMQDNGLDSVVGGMFVTVHFDSKGNIDSVSTEIKEY